MALGRWMSDDLLRAAVGFLAEGGQNGAPIVGQFWTPMETEPKVHPIFCCSYGSAEDQSRALYRRLLPEVK